ncbi:MAG: DUF4388 domain-containing protein [Proteobacteria bacterium]|nr:DUF4388 domain-containing protein [Pseudomonadota bacterium]
MSLIGSLEDLGLGDILQIISLSQKSGVLAIRSEAGEGRILFVEGLVRGAVLKGGPDDLRGVLVGGEIVSGAEFDEAARTSRESGVSIERVLADTVSIPSERIDSLRREAVESAVVSMFRWKIGEFSFDVREEPEPDDPPLFLETGVNAQYLAMEGSRLNDEAVEAERLDRGDAPAPEDELSADVMFGADLEFDGESEPAEPALDAESAEETKAPLVPESVGEVAAPLSPADVRAEQIDRVASAATHRVEQAKEGAPRPPVVAIDSDLTGLEWTKRALADDFPRTHIFQRSELGLARIRQYLVRAETPLVLLSPDVPGDPLSGILDARDFARRLKTQSARIRVLWLCEEDAEQPESVAPADGIVERPSAHNLSDPARAEQVERVAARLRAAVVDAVVRPVPEAGPAAGARSDAIPPEIMRRLNEAMTDLRDAASRGEVLPLVIRFAAERFSRVAMFGVRDDLVMGMAQHGLNRAGGPDDAGLRAVRMRAECCSWFRRVLATRTSLRSAPIDDGDRELGLMLGDASPSEAYLAPIESSGQIVALLYGDNLPSSRLVGDTSALEVVLHHAGLALDRAALERLEGVERVPADGAESPLHEPAADPRREDGSPSPASRNAPDDR